MCVAHSIVPPAAQFNSVSFCLLVVIPNITGLLRYGCFHKLLNYLILLRMQMTQHYLPV